MATAGARWFVAERRIFRRDAGVRRIDGNQDGYVLSGQHGAANAYGGDRVVRSENRRTARADGWTLHHRDADRSGVGSSDARAGTARREGADVTRCGCASARAPGSVAARSAVRRGPSLESSSGKGEALRG